MANYEYLTSNGVIIPDTSEVLADVEAEYRAVYGADFVVDSSTEQGREIDAEVTSRMSVLRNNANVANQINPNIATGQFLDAVYAFSSGQRDAAERSTVTCTLSGVRNTIIPVGSLVRDENNNIWQSNVSAIIPTSGSIDVSFFSVDFGDINAAIGEVNTIVDGVLGWETVTNEAASINGKLEQTDVSTRAQRNRELALNARNNTLSIISSISELENVGSLSFRENNTDSTMTIDGVEMIARSTYVCVDGGANTDIADAYYRARSGGTGFNGDTTVTVTDPNSLQNIPVQFDRPDDRPKLVRITVRASLSLDPSTSIKSAVVDYSNGLIDGEVGFVVGGDVSAFEIAAAVNATVAGVFVSKCEIAEDDGLFEYTTDTIQTEIFEKASITENNVQVIMI